MKRHLFLFAFFSVALTMQLIASESIGPPGVAEVRCDSFILSVSAEKVIVREFNAVGLGAVLVSTSTAIDVAPGFPRPVIGLAFMAVYPRVEPMLAGLMYGTRLNVWMDNAAEAYLIPKVSDTRPDLGAVA